ncbi:hypothetical protein HDU76_012248, partial [Blyttiomyces sp. JEL0837]
MPISYRGQSTITIPAGTVLWSVPDSPTQSFEEGIEIPATLEDDPSVLIDLLFYVKQEQPTETSNPHTFFTEFYGWRDSLQKEYPSNEPPPSDADLEPELFITEEDYNPELHGKDDSIPEEEETNPTKSLATADTVHVATPASFPTSEFPPIEAFDKDTTREEKLDYLPPYKDISDEDLLASFPLSHLLENVFVPGTRTGTKTPPSMAIHLKPNAAAPVSAPYPEGHGRGEIIR